MQNADVSVASIRENLPELVPVEVPKPRAKEWFRSLLSGVQFLHERGIVHNDIKYVCFIFSSLKSLDAIYRPANILLSQSRVPVLVDFGFAEKYDIGSVKAFHSNLTYGTTEVRSATRITVCCLTNCIWSSSTCRRNAQVVFCMIHGSRISGLLESHSSRFLSAGHHSRTQVVNNLPPKRILRITGSELYALL